MVGFLTRNLFSHSNVWIAVWFLWGYCQSRVDNRIADGMEPSVCQGICSNHDVSWLAYDGNASL